MYISMLCIFPLPERTGSPDLSRIRFYRIRIGVIQSHIVEREVVLISKGRPALKAVSILLGTTYENGKRTKF